MPRKGPRIEVVAAAAGPTERTIKLLGDLRSGATTTLYGKVAGYLKTISVDKGDKVEAGQVLAYIESPELEQQYAGASADLANKRRNRDRTRELYSKGIATQVALNQAETDATVAENTVAVLETQRSYQTVRAPFGGRVTARFVDPGALITNAQTNVTSALPMLTISDDSQGADLRLCAAGRCAVRPRRRRGRGLGRQQSGAHEDRRRSRA